MKISEPANYVRDLIQNLGIGQIIDYLPPNMVIRFEPCYPGEDWGDGEVVAYRKFNEVKFLSDIIYLNKFISRP